MSAGRKAWRSTMVDMGRPLARAARMKLELSTSIRLPRITRPTVDRLITASKVTGSTTKRHWPSFQPPDGSHCSQSANTVTSRGPMTNEGTDPPILQKTMRPWSTQLFCRNAAQIPNTTPASTAISMDKPPISKDTGNALATRSLTDQSAYRNEAPRSPCSKLLR